MEKKLALKKPMFGSNYYPEAWDRSEIDKDLDQMVEIGLNCIRIAEFAWDVMQPNKDTYDFSLFREVVDKCKSRGISVVMCSPSHIPPRWMGELDPDLMLLTHEGKRMTFGRGGGFFCYNNETYREYLAKFMEKAAQEFANDENVVGWQLDNEMNPSAHSYYCCCKTCEIKFRERMREKYDNNIEKLNRDWGTYIRANQYRSFEDLGTPARNFHPAFKFYWAKYQNDCHHEVLKLQRDIIHKYMDVPTGTCTMPCYFLDHETYKNNLEVAQFNQYYYKTEYGDEGYADVLYWYSLLRGLNEKPFWVTETSTCWNGGMAGEYMRPKNFNRMNVWNAYLRGAELVNYWLWRAHYGGGELMHGAVVSSCGRPLHATQETVQVAKELEKLAPILNGTKQEKSEIAIHTSYIANKMFEIQPMSPKFSYRWRMLNSVHHPIEQMHYPVDVIYPSKDLNGYKIVITPFMPYLKEENLDTRILEWVKKGGTWIVGPATDIRKECGSKFTDKAMGMLEEITGCRQEFTLVKGANYPMYFKDGEMTDTIDEMYEMYTVADESKNVEVLAEFGGEFGEGYVAAAKIPYGKGQIILLGALPEKAGWQSFIRKIADENGVKPISEASETVALTIRKGDAGELFSAVEIMHRENAYAVIPFDGEDVLTGKKYAAGDRKELAPYDVLIVKKK